MVGSTSSAESLYTRMQSAYRSPKAARSLANIKAAVDLVLKGSRELTLAAVATVCVERFGGPKYQSICNNRDYRAYIEARFGEARAASIANRSGRLPPAEADAVMELLRAEVRALTEEITRLKKAFRTVAPVPINALLDKANAPSAPAAPGYPLSPHEKQDLKKFLRDHYDLGFDLAEDGRLVTIRGLTVIGGAGMAALKRLVEP